MTILYLAFAIYIIGVAIVLFLRPNSMFRPGGWKEFGLNTGSSYTVFPFWMFTILWAIISYVLATLLTILFTTLTLRSSPRDIHMDEYLPEVMMEPELEPVYQPISQAPHRVRMPRAMAAPTMAAPTMAAPTMAAPIMAASTMAAPTMTVPALPAPAADAAPASFAAMKQPGYYILESAANTAPKYIYYGTEPPTLTDVLASSR